MRATMPARLSAPLAAALRVGFHSGLASALFVAGFQPYASLVLTGGIDPVASSSMLLFVWMMYLLDRLKTNPEDAHDAEANAAAFTRRHRVGCWTLFAALATAEVVLVIEHPRLLRAIGLSLAVSVLYLVRLPLLGRRVKEIPYLKCFFLSAISLVIVASFTPGLEAAPPGRVVAVAGICFLLYFLNFSLYDIKDLEGDARANLKTLAALVPVPIFLRAHRLLSLLVLLLGLVVLGQGPGREVAAVCLFHAGASWWLERHPFDAAACGAIDAGYGLILGASLLRLVA